MKNSMLLLPLLILSFAISAQTVNFSIQGHEDDWQLFMSKQIVPDIKAGGKVVFITFTAGDAGYANRAYGTGTTPYFIAREMGSVYSSKWAVDLIQAAPDPVPTAALVAVNGHNITKYVYKNIVNYFLRLPDGFQNGTGDPGSGNVSMQQLREGKIPKLYAVDTSTFYVGWADLVNTIKTIILNEKKTGSQAWINVPSLDTAGTSPSTTKNVADHSDHRTSSHAAQEAVAAYAWVGIRSWMDYETRNNAINLTTSEHQYETSLFAICTWAEVERRYVTDFETWHQGWLNRDISAITRNPSGNAPSSLPLDDNGLTRIIPAAIEPAIKLYMTNPISSNDKILMYLTLPEKGQLSTSIYDLTGKLVYSVVTKIKAKGRKDIQVDNPSLPLGMYIIKNTLNDRYVESTKLLVD